SSDRVCLTAAAEVEPALFIHCHSISIVECRLCRHMASPVFRGRRCFQFLCMGLRMSVCVRSRCGLQYCCCFRCCRTASGRKAFPSIA
ncbi:hypothetical protein HN51_018557, partial [Arachis hypogaea]